MRKSLALCPLLLIVLALLAAACSGSDSAEPVERIERLWIGAELVDCVGVVPQKCLQVRLAEDAQVQWFYDDIEGYTHVEGTAAVVDVAVSILENPPADGSVARYRLIEIVETTAGAGTVEVAGIDGTSWQFIGFADGQLFDPVPAGVSASISFDGDAVTGNGGCNGFGGSFETDGQSVTFTGLSMTLIGCEGDAMDTESQFFAILDAVTTAEVTFDDRLILAPPRGLTLVFRPA